MFRDANRKSVVMCRCLYRKPLKIFIVFYISFLLLWYKLLWLDGSVSSKGNASYDIPNTVIDKSLSKKGTIFGSDKKDKRSELSEVDMKNLNFRTFTDLKSILNVKDNLLIVKYDYAEQGEPCLYCMDIDASGEEIFNQSRLNKTLVRKRKCNGCFKNRFGLVISGEDICRKDKVILIFLISSTHQNFLRRAVLRKTWLTYANRTSDVRYAFVLGETQSTHLRKTVENENEKYRDIVKWNFMDSFKNLTTKTIMAYKWATKKCPQAKYVMKTDDDMFVNVPVLLHMLKRPDIQTKAQRSILGSCHRSKPVRYVIHKYFVSYQSYPRSLYPRFCSGTGYVTSMRVVRKVISVSPNIPFIHLEDVYVGFCMEYLRYSMRYVSGFRIKILPDLYNGCVYRGQSAVSTHARRPDNILLIWRLQCTETF